MQTSLVVFFLAWLGLVTTNEESDDEIHFTNSWAVHIDNGDLDAVNDIAQKHGFINQGQIGSLPGFYHFVKHNVRERSRRSLDDHSETLLSEPRVKWVEQQRILERSKRDVIPGEDELVQRSVARLRRDTAVTIRDPFFKDQWYLQNIGQSSGPTGVDINVLPVWARGYSGKGVVVSVLDDGIDHTHPDLKNNYDPDASFDFNDFDGDPKPRDENLENWMKDLKAEMHQMKQNQTRNSLSITSETKPGDKPIKVTVSLQNISRTGTVSIQAFSSDGHCFSVADHYRVTWAI